jgi:queuosine precursor transporter
MNRWTGWAAILAYIGVIVAANYAVEHWGVVEVGFGYQAPVAAFFAGAALTLRDLGQRGAGREPILFAIVIGAALSYLIAPAFAVASGVAFLCSELADFAVYTPLERRQWYAALLASNIVGLVLDSIIFLWIAFGNFDYLRGQLLAKGAVTAVAVAFIAATFPPRSPAYPS